MFPFGLSLTEFYYKIRKHIAFVVGYTENKNLKFIIEGAKLKPLYILENPKHTKIELYDWWVDEHGNSLKIVGKELEIIPSDTSLIDRQFWNTDLYAGLGPDKIIEISRMFYLFIGKDEQSQNHYIISFLGIDNYLRTFIYLNKEWKSYPTLALGLRTLTWMNRFQDIDNFKELPQKYQIIIPCEKQESWLTCCPVKQDFLAMIKEKNLPDLDFLNK